MRIVFKTLVFLCLFFSLQAHAQTYYWQLGAKQFPSPQAACDYALQQNQSAYPAVTFSIKSVSINTSGQSTSATCTFLRVLNGNPLTPDWTAVATRYGTACEEGKTYNPVTGACEEPPKPCEAGVPFLARSNGPLVGAPRVFVASSSPGPVCRDSCFHGDGTERPTSCYRNPDPGQTGQGFCNYVLLSTGASCSGESGIPGGTGPALNPEPPTDPEEPPSDPDNPCSGIPGYVWTGSTCIKDPGTGDGGDGPGDGDGDGDGPGDGDGDGGGNNGGGDGGGDNGGGDGGGNNGGGDGPGGDGTGSSGGGNGNGDGDGQGDGAGGPVGGAGCEGEACKFQAPEGYGDDIPSISQSLQRLYTDIGKSPIANAVSAIKFPTGGSCPQGSVTLFNTAITFDTHCDLWGQIAPILSAVFLAFWCLLAVRVFLSA